MKEVIAKCIGCGHKRKIKAGEIPKGETPMCPRCSMPMIAEKAIVSDADLYGRLAKGDPDSI